MQIAHTPSMPSIATMGELSNISSDETIKTNNELLKNNHQQSRLNRLNWISDISVHLCKLGRFTIK